MSSTDKHPADARARAFFREHLAPAAARLRERGVSFFALGPGDPGESWYVPYPPDAAEFETVSASDWVEQLGRMWERQQLPELVAMVPALRELAREFDTPPADETEVSPFIYAMF